MFRYKKYKYFVEINKYFVEINKYFVEINKYFVEINKYFIKKIQKSVLFYKNMYNSIKLCENILYKIHI